MSKSKSDGNVQVVCRFRPLNEKEKAMGMDLCMNILDKTTVEILTDDGKPEKSKHKFTLDRVFPCESTQQEVYEAAAKPIVLQVLEGFNGTVFCYGQTSSGKTFSMQGPDVYDPKLKGIIPRMIRTLFESIDAAEDSVEFVMKVGYVEIYLEKIKDLLNPKMIDLKIKEDKRTGIYIDQQRTEYVSSELDVFDYMQLGLRNREVGSTNMNAGSSRSHSLFMMFIQQTDNANFSTKNGKLFLVDLAGSEKVGKTGAEGKRLDEAKSINQSLTMLGMVINALTDGKSQHIPYRDSKLTRVLQDSLGGNSKTSLIVTASPSPFNDQETLSTLRFGMRAKNIKNNAKVNKELTVAELKHMLEQAEKKIAERDRKIRTLEIKIKAAKGEEVGEELEGLEQEAEQEQEEVLSPQSPQDQHESDQEEEKESKPALNSDSEEVSPTQEEDPNLPSIEVRMSRKFSHVSVDESVSASASDSEQDNLEDLLMDHPELEEQIRQEFEEVQDELEKQKEETDAQALRADDLKKELCSTMARFETLEKENSALISRIDCLRIESLELEDYIQDKEQELEALQCEHERLNADISDYTEPPEGEGEAGAEQQVVVEKQEEEQEEEVKQQQTEEMEEAKKKAREEQIARLTQEMQSSHNNEKKQILQDLNNRVAKVVQLEMEIHDIKEKYEQLNSSKNDKAMKSKCANLEKTVQQLNTTYHQNIRKISEIQVKKKLYKKRMLRKEERLKELEAKFKENKDKEKQLMQKNHALDGQMQHYQSNGVPMQQASGGTKVVKKLKGGQAARTNKGEFSLTSPKGELHFALPQPQ